VRGAPVCGGGCLLRAIRRRDGGIALALLVLPWVLVWALAPHHHIDAITVTILAAVTIPLSALWLAWATFRNTSRPGPVDRGVGTANVTAGAGSVVADRGGTAIGQGAAGAEPATYDSKRLCAALEQVTAAGDALLTCRPLGEMHPRALPGEQPWAGQSVPYRSDCRQADHPVEVSGR
jgi:hypothetical protein